MCMHTYCRSSRPTSPRLGRTSLDTASSYRCSRLAAHLLLYLTLDLTLPQTLTLTPILTLALTLSRSSRMAARILCAQIRRCASLALSPAPSPPHPHPLHPATHMAPPNLHPGTHLGLPPPRESCHTPFAAINSPPPSIVHSTFAPPIANAVPLYSLIHVSYLLAVRQAELNSWNEACNRIGRRHLQQS